MSEQGRDNVQQGSLSEERRRREGMYYRTFEEHGLLATDVAMDVADNGAQHVGGGKCIGKKDGNSAGNTSLAPLAEMLHSGMLGPEHVHAQLQPRAQPQGQLHFGHADTRAHMQGPGFAPGLDFTRSGSGLSTSTSDALPLHQQALQARLVPLQLPRKRSGDEMLGGDADFVFERQFSSMTAPSRQGSAASWAPIALERQATNESVLSMPRHGSGGSWLMGHGSDRSFFSAPLPLPPAMQPLSTHAHAPLAPISTRSDQALVDAPPTTVAGGDAPGPMSRAERGIPIEMLLNPTSEMSLAEDQRFPGAVSRPLPTVQRQVTDGDVPVEQFPVYRTSSGGGRLRVDPSLLMGPDSYTSPPEQRREANADMVMEREVSATASLSGTASGKACQSANDASAGSTDGPRNGSTAAAAESDAARRFWTKEEDEQLMRLIQKHGPRHWDYLASLMDTRSGQQVRLRYNNHLRFTDEEKHSSFTPAQDKLIFEAGKSSVRRWTVLAQQMGKSHNSIKNRYHVLLRRRTRLQKLQSELNALKESKDGSDGVGPC